MEVDRPSVAVRSDGLVRIAIADFQGPCCPLQVPLKVATRSATGGWTHLPIASYGDHPVPHFLANGNLGVMYNDFGARMTIRFAEVTSSSATIQTAYSLGLNPSGFTRLMPWVTERTGDLQAIIQRGIRLRRTASGWASAAFSGTLHDLAVKPTGQVLILSSQGLWTFAGPGLTLTGKLDPVSASAGGNLVLDPAGLIHVAFLSGGRVTYGRSSGSGFFLETVADNVKELLNDQALVLGAGNQPYLIYRNAAGNVVVATKTLSGWSEQADLGPGMHGTMVKGPRGRLHASFTSTSDRLVHYAVLQPCGGSFLSYGSGVAGAGAFVPALSGSGCPEPGQTFAVDITKGLGGGSGILFFGATRGIVNFACGALLVFPPILTLSTPLGGRANLPGDGTATLPVPIPGIPQLSGVKVLFQFWGIDLGACGAISMSPGLEVTIG